MQRMRAPHWREYLPALDQMDRAKNPLWAQWIRNRLIAAELFDVGIDVNCAPLADIAEDMTHPVLRNLIFAHIGGVLHEFAQEVRGKCNRNCFIAAFFAPGNQITGIPVIH